MRFRSFVLLSTLLLPVPLFAQPPVPSGDAPPREDGPWAADADGDEQITRAEMTAHMERRFALMDPDGDGLVPVSAMQQMLGHAPRPRQNAQDGGKGGGRHQPGGPGRGPGARPEGRPDHDGPPPGGRPPAGDRADGAPPPPGRAMPYPEDGNDDGMIDRAEFLAPALALFDDWDRNGDGVLSADELPPPPPPASPPQD